MQICRLDAQGSRCGYLDFQRKSWREFLSILTIKEEAMRLLPAILATLILVAACGDPNENDNLCQDVVCNHGTCNPGTGKCDCNKDYFDSPKGKCTLKFDLSEYLAYTAIGPNSSGRLEVKGQTGADSGYNGFYVDYTSGAVSEDAWLLLGAASGAGLPKPGIPGKILTTAHGVKRFVVAKNAPFGTDGTLKQITLARSLKIHFKGFRGTALSYNAVQKNLTSVENFTFLKTGTLATAKGETLYLLDSNPKLSATATHKGKGVVEIDCTGTRDEGKESPHMLTFSASGDGTPLTLTAVSGATHKFSATLTGGTHNITVKVTDPNGSSDTKALTVNVDLCANVQCKAWETCRKLDGKCTGSNPCSPNPCKNGGTCSGSTGTAKCTCVAPWSGKTCETKDLCYQVSCNSHGTCDKSTGKCKCTGNWDSSSNCSKCLNGYVPDATGKNCVIPKVTITTPLPKPCTTTPVKMCDGNKTYTISFTYTGKPTKITGWCTIQKGTTGTITNIKYSSGKGAFTYNSSKSGGSQETIHIKSEWGTVNKTDTHTHYIY